MHVKTATNYGESVKALMKGGDLLIESCGCILSLKIKRHVLCTHICTALTNSPRAAALPLNPSASHPLKDINIVFGAGKYEMLSNGEGETVICL